MVETHCNRGPCSVRAVVTSNALFHLAIDAGKELLLGRNCILAAWSFGGDPTCRCYYFLSFRCRKQQILKALHQVSVWFDPTSQVSFAYQMPTQSRTYSADHFLSVTAPPSPVTLYVTCHDVTVTLGPFDLHCVTVTLFSSRSVGITLLFLKFFPARLLGQFSTYRRTPKR